MSLANFNPAPRKHSEDGGRVNFMCRSGGYVMCRKPRCNPFVLSEKQWQRLELWQDDAKETTWTK